MLEILLHILTSFWSTVSEMAPYLLLGFLVAGALSVLISPAFVERHLGSGRISSIFTASLFGVPLPLCSCGVIPVAASLRRHGASRGATTAFLISTPQTGVDSIFVTLSLLGVTFMIFRPIAALISGLIGGALVTVATKNDHDHPIAKPAQQAHTKTEQTGKLRRALVYGFDALPRDIGKALLLGLVVAAIISAVVSPGQFKELLGRTGYLGHDIGVMLLAMLMGIPLYVCATASVPVAAALMASGVSPGAAFVFLMTGPATNAATIAVIWRTMGRRTAIIYLVTVALCAVAAGLTLDYIFAAQGISAQPFSAWMLPAWFKWSCAVLLAVVLGRAILARPLRTDPNVPAEEGLARWKIQIKGMTCSHCAETIRRGLMDYEAVHSASVDLDSGEAIVQAREVDPDELRNIVEQLGYNVTSLSSDAEKNQ